MAAIPATDGVDLGSKDKVCRSVLLQKQMKRLIRENEDSKGVSAFYLPSQRHCKYMSHVKIRFI